MFKFTDIERMVPRANNDLAYSWATTDQRIQMELRKQQSSAVPLVDNKILSGYLMAIGFPNRHTFDANDLNQSGRHDLYTQLLSEYKMFLDYRLPFPAIGQGEMVGSMISQCSESELIEMLRSSDCMTQFNLATGGLLPIKFIGTESWVDRVYIDTNDTFEVNLSHYLKTMTTFKLMEAKGDQEKIGEWMRVLVKFKDDFLRDKNRIANKDIVSHADVTRYQEIQAKIVDFNVIVGEQVGQLLASDLFKDFEGQKVDVFLYGAKNAIKVKEAEAFLAKQDNTADVLMGVMQGKLNSLFDLTLKDRFQKGAHPDLTSRYRDKRNVKDVRSLNNLLLLMKCFVKNKSEDPLDKQALLTAFFDKTSSLFNKRMGESIQGLSHLEGSKGLIEIKRNTNSFDVVKVPDLSVLSQAEKEELSKALFVYRIQCENFLNLVEAKEMPFILTEFAKYDGSACREWLLNIESIHTQLINVHDLFSQYAVFNDVSTWILNEKFKFPIYNDLYETAYSKEYSMVDSPLELLNVLAIKRVQNYIVSGAGEPSVEKGIKDFELLKAQLIFKEKEKINQKRVVTLDTL